MGTYCYKISRKGRKVKGAPTCDGKVYKAEFAYKPHLYAENQWSKYVAPTLRAWKKQLFYWYFDADTIDRVRFVMDWVDGAPVYSRKSVSWLDTKEPGEIVGHLRMCGETGRFRFDGHVA
jgi:hypothetical protein